MVKIFVLAAVAGTALIAGPANALPVFTMGSFDFTNDGGNGGDTTGDGTNHTVFNLVDNSFSTTQPDCPPPDDFSNNGPTFQTLGSTLDFGTNGLDFGDHGPGDSQGGGGGGGTWQFGSNDAPGNPPGPSSQSGDDSQSGGNGQSNSDTPAVPEPTALSLFGAALAVLGRVRRRTA